MAGNIDPAVQAAINAAIAQVAAQLTTQIQHLQGVQGPQDLVGPPGSAGDGEPRPMVVKSPEDIGFFDPAYEDANNGFIVNAGRHVCYRDIYVFVDRLKDLVKGSTGEQKIKDLIPGCLRGAYLTWYSTELSELEKDLLRSASLDQWINALVRRFKERGAAALQAHQAETYSMTDARSGRTPRAYVQDIMRHAQAAEFSAVYNQLLMAWNNLNLDFRMQIPEPTTTTSLNSFLDSLDSKATTWQERAARRYPSSNGSINSGRNRQPMSKQDRGRTDGFFRQ